MTGDLLSQRSCRDALAIIDGADGTGVTWWEVADQAGRWATLAARRRTAGRARPVGLALADPVAMAANFVAAMAAGVVVAPLDPSAPPADLAARLAQLRIEALVTGPGTATALGIETWTAGRRELRLAAGEATPAAGRGGVDAGQAGALPAVPSGVAAILASSGTTGTPKIIPLTEPQLLATAEGVADALELTPSDRGYSPLPLFHINGLVVGVLSALVAGSTIVVDRQFSRRRFWNTVERSEATWLNLVPAILAILGGPDAPTAPASVSGRVRLARSASAPLSEAVRERFERHCRIPVVETYGMTEAASQITANPPGAVRPGSVGLAVGLEIRVVPSVHGRDEPDVGNDGRSTDPGGSGSQGRGGNHGPSSDPTNRGRPCAAAPGRVQIRGARVTPVYWTADGPGWQLRDALGAEGWLDTGDLGWMDDAGYLYLCGRDGDVINRGGEKIQPREVEEVLLGDSRVTAAVVVGRPHPVTGEEPVAFVLASPAATLAPDDLAADLARRCELSLSRYKRPAEVRVAETLPSGPTGKVRRAQVREALECLESLEADGIRP